MNLREAYSHAATYWEANTPSSAEVQKLRCQKCIGALSWATLLRDLKPTHGRDILTHLSNRGLSRKSVSDYYATFKRMLALNGWTHFHDWPKASVPPRKLREATSQNDLDRVLQHLLEEHWYNTADLVALLAGTGLRVGVEGLRPGAYTFSEQATAKDHFGVLRVRGKGDHERRIPVLDPRALSVLRDPGRVRAIGRVPYETHRARVNAAKKALGIKGDGVAIFHGLRHKYATEALERSGGNLKLVQELLGHSDPGTTAKYAHVSTERKLEALGYAPPSQSPMETTQDVQVPQKLP